MGNESSTEMGDGRSTVLQSQGEKNLWTLELQREAEGGDGEGVCVFSRRPGKGPQAELCSAGVEHLRVLRHPNIIKYIESEVSPEQIVLMTEPLIPVIRALNGATEDSVVMGWRGLGAGLDFLHRKAGLSHNNISMSCVYINVLDSQWKLGGFEAACQHKAITSGFISFISSLRHENAIPPEDKAGKVSAPVHARDVWGLGHLFVTILEEAGLEAQVPDSTFQYINDEMLNPDPLLRPAVSEIIAQPWMSNQSSVIREFLSNLTLKTKGEKDKFFRDLASVLHSLSPHVVAEHIVPLLVTPLVMTEPLAHEALWKHLLWPVTQENPRPKAFDPSLPSPLLDVGPFKSHILPLVLNLLESRDSHVRLTLLSHLGGYAPLCSNEDLVGVVLPEVLVGLKDTSDEVVRATLHALGELVPLIGADLVMGTSRKHIFTDAKPRATSSLSVETQKPVSVDTKDPSSTHKTMPPLSKPKSERSKEERSREDRMREMREKREQQRLKKMAHTKLGHQIEDPEAFVEPVPEALPTDLCPQYSPSISHDEVEYAGSNTSIEVTVQSSGVISGGSDADEQRGGKWAELTDKEDKSDDWGESWSGIEDTGQSVSGIEHIPTTLDKQVEWEQAPAKLEKPVKQVTPRKPSSSSSKLVLKSANTQGNSSSTKSSVGRILSTEDTRRLEEQAVREQEELDLFADMTPKISTSRYLVGSGVSGSGQTGTTPLHSPLGVGDGTSKNTPTPTSTALQYQPQQEECSGDWNSEDWNENF